MVKQLNSCKAFYDYNFLQSYKSIVAFYDVVNDIYYLRRYNSATTTKHFWKWFDKVEIGESNYIFYRMYIYAREHRFEFVKAVINEETCQYDVMPAKDYEYYDALDGLNMEMSL